MSATPNPELAQSLKEEGNALYKSGELLKGMYPTSIEQYRLACIADPSSPLLLFNLSAAQFETGEYVGSLFSTKSAIELCNPSVDAELLAKLWLRRGKCELHGGNFKEAEKAAKKVVGFKATDVIKRDAKTLQRAAAVTEGYNNLMLEEEIIGMTLDMPKYRPRFCTDISEYYNIGHDSAQSQFDSSNFPAGQSSEYSFFFGGIGDARHLYATLIAISQHEAKNNITSGKYHFTINDIKPHTIARDFLVLLLIHQLSKLPSELSNDTDKQKKTDILALLFYIYVGVLMPARVHSHLQRLLVTARNALTTQNEDIPPWFWVSERDSQKIKDVYETWMESIFPVSHAQAQVSEAERMMPPGDKPKGCEREFTAYRRTGALFPPKEIRGHEPKLMELLAGGPGVGGPGAAGWEKKVRAYVGKEWRINMTLVDREWCKQAGVWDVSFDPFSIAEKFYENVKIPEPERPTQLYDYFEPFFMHTAKAFSQIGSNTKIECNIDDCLGALEEIRFSDKIVHKGVDRPDKFPRTYDRIHLSNIPDYVGGHLSTAVYVLPVLKNSLHAHLTSTCLVNPPLWQSVEDYIAEYLCLPTLPILQSATCLKLCSEQDAVLSEFMPMAEYINWQLSSSKIPLPYSELLPRKALTRWLLQVFFKLAVPPMRELRSMARVFAPLNLTAFIRLLVRVVEIGYPAHWVASVAEEILENRLTTTTRPPSASPYRINDIEKEWPAKQISTSPFIPEMEMLVSTWLRILPFGIISPSHIPPPEKIFEYKFTLSAPQFRDEFVNVLMLIFYPEGIFERLTKGGHGGAKTGIRDILTSQGTEHPDKKAMREKMMVYSTFGWDKSKNEVTFRMKEGWIESQRKEDRWVAGLWRTDDWTMCSAPTSLRGGNLMKGLVNWIDPTIGMSEDDDEE